MNYKLETIMTWIMYVKNGIWEVIKKNDYADNPEVVQSKFEDLFFNELVREFDDARHMIPGLCNQIGTIDLLIDRSKYEFRVSDSYNNLLSIYNGIYK